MKIHKYNEMMRHLTRPKDTLSKSEKAEVVKDFYKPKPEPMGIVPYIEKMNRLYGYDPSAEEPEAKVAEEERFNDKILKRDKYEEKKVAGIKDSALYKLLSDPKVLGTELGHDTILQIMNLIQGSGIVKKPKKESVKIAVVKKPKKEVDHIALLSNGEEFIV